MSAERIAELEAELEGLRFELLLSRTAVLLGNCECQVCNNRRAGGIADDDS